MMSKIELLRMIAEYLNEETDRYKMLHGALKLLIDNSEFDTGWVFFINHDKKHELAAHYKLPTGLGKESFKGLTNEKCWCVNQYNRGNLNSATNIIACSRLDKLVRENQGENEKITHHATVPLTSSGESFGLLNVATKNIKEYDKETLDLLESVAFQIGSTLKRLELTELEKENALIQERQRLARDLHDSINQMLFSINIMSNAGVRVAHHDQTKNTLNKIENTSKYAMQEMKALVWQLKPIGLENGIVDAVVQYAELVNVNVEIDIEGFYSLPDRSEIEIFRVIQEALNNTSKHSGTNHSKIDMIVTETLFSLTIKDKGKGFDINEVTGLSYGLSNMKERIEKLGGNFKIQSKQNKGTKLFITVPK